MRALALGALAATSCSVEVVEYTPVTRHTVVEIPVTPETDLDILFVVDDSAQMQVKQDALKGAIPTMLQRLERLTPNGLPDLHIGVVTTDLGTSSTMGLGPSVAGCNDPEDGRLRVGVAQVNGVFVSDRADGSGGRVRNYSSSLEGTVQNMLTAGSSGCELGQPLGAMRAALDNNAANAGFLRPPAILAIYFLTDADDCSARTPDLFGPESPTLGPQTPFRCTRFGVTCADGGTSPDEMAVHGTKTGCTGSLDPSAKVEPVTSYAEFLGNLKSVPDRIIVGGAFGPREPVRVDQGSAPATYLVPACTFLVDSTQQEAKPAVRLQAFMDLFPERSSARTICSVDQREGIHAFTNNIMRKMGSPCILPMLADADPAQPMVQPDCIVEDVRFTDARPIAPCPGGDGNDCWRLAADATTCPMGMNLKLDVVRASTPPSGTVTRMRCRLAP